jgi:hypothetical protein
MPWTPAAAMGTGSSRPEIMVISSLDLQCSVYVAAKLFTLKNPMK